MPTESYYTAKTTFHTPQIVRLIKDQELREQIAAEAYRKMEARAKAAEAKLAEASEEYMRGAKMLAENATVWKERAEAAAAGPLTVLVAELERLRGLRTKAESIMTDVAESESAALRARVAELEAERENWRMSSVCREQQAELAELRKDKARLDWLETTRACALALCGDDHHGEPNRHVWEVGEMLPDGWRDTLRAAIDHAMTMPPRSTAPTP